MSEFPTAGPTVNGSDGPDGVPRGSMDSPGDSIGHFKLIEILGEGGFGTVWLAERREPMVQRVALKIIKPGMDSRAVIARFEQERQALAVMDHPNVAKVLDGGVTPTGRPYFVMEYVKGEPITTFADRHRFPIRQRLELFIPVCEAVQHAHHKGLIHRDIKPSNVLVAEIEGKPVPKVIDFGVAKAISDAGWMKTAHTQSGMVIGTPEYMSPEQVAGELDVDTRADVYSLGVMLYELLTGELPFDSGSLRKAALVEIARIIKEVTPPKPSTKLAQLVGDRTTTIAQARSTSSARIASELRRVLDWIPLMALRKERERRYPSPQALADDVHRYLEGRPLIAAPDSRAYLARKFVRRNKVQVTATSAVFLALTAGLALALWQRSEAITARNAESKQRARADERADAATKAEASATAARDAEKERADQLKKVSDFQARMLGQIDITKTGVDLMTDVRKRFVSALEQAGVPEPDRAAQVQNFGTLLNRVNATDAAAAMIDRTILQPAIRTIDEQFKDDPKTDASLRQALANLYRTIGLYDAAIPLQNSALATRRRVLGEEHPETLFSMNDLGELLYQQSKLVDAEPNFREALEKRRRVRGEEHPETLLSISNLGLLLQSQGKLTEAEPYVRDALQKRRRLLGEEHPETLVSINNMGVLLESQSKLTEAEPFYREAIEKRRRLLPDHPHTLYSLNNLGNLLRAQGKLAEAEPYWREALEKSRRVMGEEHPDTLRSINNMGFLLQAQGKLPEAEPYLREALEKRRRVLGDEHPNTLNSINHMGSLLFKQGKFAEAEPYYREAVERSRRVHGEENPDTLVSIINLGALLRAQSKLDQAEPVLREALEKFRRVLGEEHPNTLVSIIHIGSVLVAQNKPRDAIDLLVPAEPAVRKTFTSNNTTQLASFLTALGRARANLSDDPDRFKLAEANLLEAHAIYLAAKGRGPTHKDTLDCVQALVDLHTAWNTAEPSKGYGAKAAEWKAKLSPPKSPQDLSDQK